MVLKVYAEYLNEKNESVDYITLQNVMAEVSELVCKTKDDYHKQLARKLTNPKTSSKTMFHFKNILQWKESSTNTTANNK